MNSAKDIIVKPILAADANRIVRAIHYSGKVVNNSQIHLGVFLDGKCGGAMQFGPSLDKRKLIGLVRGTKWNEFIELNRMAFADWLPRNSESRAIGFSMRWLRKTYPWLKWVVSFADATQCGDGAIYRASGFILTQIHVTRESIRLPSGEMKHRVALNTDGALVTKHGGVRWGNRNWADKLNGTPVDGFQLRYLFFLDRSARTNLTVPEIPFSRIAELGASMYRGKRAASIDADAPGHQPGEGSSTLTAALQT